MKSATGNKSYLTCRCEVNYLFDTIVIFADSIVMTVVAWVFFARFSVSDPPLFTFARFGTITGLVTNCIFITIVTRIWFTKITVSFETGLAGAGGGVVGCLVANGVSVAFFAWVGPHTFIIFFLISFFTNAFCVSVIFAVFETVGVFGTVVTRIVLCTSFISVAFVTVITDAFFTVGTLRDQFGVFTAVVGVVRSAPRASQRSFESAEKG